MPLIPAQGKQRDGSLELDLHSDFQDRQDCIQRQYQTNKQAKIK